LIRVLIVDDHAILRAGIRLILERGLGDVLCDEASDAEQLLMKVRESHWDILILDIKMPGQSGIHVLPRIRESRPDLPVLVLTMHPEDQYGRRVLKAGAFGYMTKESAPAELLHAVQRILSGRRYISPELAERLASDLRSNLGDSVHDALSDRELEVLRMIGAGRSVGQIADELYLSPTTISTYRSRIIEKLGVKTTAELINFAIRNDLVL
jgi:two-component system, NarL family, invasion response regulator UvrY